MIYGYYSLTTGHIDRWADWNGLFYMSLPRAWAGLCLGGLVYCLTEWIKDIRFTKKGKTFLSQVEMTCVGILVFYMYTRTHRRLDFLCIGLLAVFAAICLSGKASISTKFPAFFSVISNYPLSLYVSHTTIKLLVPTVIMPKATYWQRLPAYITLSTVYAFLLMILVSELQHLQISKRLKLWLIE